MQNWKTGLTDWNVGSNMDTWQSAYENLLKKYVALRMAAAWYREFPCYAEYCDVCGSSKCEECPYKKDVDGREAELDKQLEENI
jgi:hypothetical protein